MDEQETLEATLALAGISLFGCLVTIGFMIGSMDADGFLYIEYQPEEDFFILIGVILINILFLFYFLAQTLKFRKSKNLNYRTGEILSISDKLKFYSIFYIPVQVIILYYSFKYNLTSITPYLALIFAFGMPLILLFFYNSYRIKRDVREENAEK